MFVFIALIVCVGATNICNFMDGINGITAGYSAAVLIPLLLMNRDTGFISEPLLAVALALLALAYVLFKKKYYHLHEEYLATLKNKNL